jgi:anaerobic selenocysteine-containing dehydrogenase
VKARNSLLRRFTGVLTEDLVLHHGDFGLGKVPARLKPDDTTNVVCGFCSTGCSLNIHLQKGQGINLTPTADYPVNLGMACPKGWEALAPLHAHDRATTPLLRNARGDMEETDWDSAMQIFCLRMKAIQDKHGPESIAFLSSGQIVTEEMAFLGALAKFGIGMVHCDSNTRQCMATSAVAYKQSFGFDAPPYTYQDFEESDVLVFIGSNLCITHPIMWQRVLRNKNKPEIIVVDPRKTETAMAATRHFAIRPKSDLILLYGLANLLLERGAVAEKFIERHTTGFNDFKNHVSAFTAEHVAYKTGLTLDQLNLFADLIHRGKRVSFWWTMGVNQSHEATRTAQAIINLALMTGNIGRPGTGANSITGQCNAMGSRLFSNTSNLLGGRDFLNPEHRREVAEILHIDPARIPAQNSWAYDQIVEGIANDKIKGLWIIGTNSSHSWINQSHFNESLKKLDFLVVQDMYHTTETAQQAHLVLPAAGWGEKEGHFINSERRLGLVKRISRSPGSALSDFNIFRLVAQYWGCGEMFSRWTSPEAVFQILKKLSANRPCDFSGIRDYRMLDQAGGIQWPATSENLAPERRLFEDGHFFHRDRKAKFIFDAPVPMPEIPCAEFPFLLLTGRGTSAQWHTQTRTAKSEVLRRLYPEDIYVEINTDDAATLKIRNNEQIEIASRRGQITARAFVTYAIQRGQVFIAMHYATANQLTFPAFDPHSRQPSYKACAVTIRKQIDKRTSSR